MQVRVVGRVQVVRACECRLPRECSVLAASPAARQRGVGGGRVAAGGRQQNVACASKTVSVRKVCAGGKIAGGVGARTSAAMPRGVAVIQRRAVRYNRHTGMPRPAVQQVWHAVGGVWQVL